MLPACRPNFAEVARTKYKFEQAWCKDRLTDYTALLCDLERGRSEVCLHRLDRTVISRLKACIVP